MKQLFTNPLKYAKGWGAIGSVAALQGPIDDFMVLVFWALSGAGVDLPVQVQESVSRLLLAIVSGLVVIFVPNMSPKKEKAE